MMFSVLSRGVRSSTSLLCACALATLQACGRHADEAARPAGTPEIEFAVAQRADAPLVTELPGRIEPYRTAEVRARVDGIVLKRTYDEGQVVKAGQVLFRIDPAPLKAQVDARKGRWPVRRHSCPSPVTRRRATRASPPRTPSVNSNTPKRRPPSARLRRKSSRRALRWKRRNCASATPP